MRGPVAVAAVAATVRGATARDPVVVCTFSGNESHAGAFVAHHLAVGAAHVYAVVDVSAGPATRDAFRAFQSATTVLDSTKPGIAGEHRAHADCVKRVVRDLAAKEPWFGGAKHAWIAQIDVDEYVLPVDPWSDLGETLERYGRAREWSLVLQRPWFGGGHAEAEVACAAAPPTFRFMRYGTAASALGPSGARHCAAGAAARGSHCTTAPSPAAARSVPSGPAARPRTSREWTRGENISRTAWTPKNCSYEILVSH